MDDPTDKVNDESIEAGPDIDLNVNGGDPLPDLPEDDGSTTDHTTDE